MEQVGSLEPLPPSRFQSKVPRDLETICLKAMAKEPHRRYRSASDLAQDLERFQSGESILARREGILGRLWRKLRRRPLTSAAFFLVIAFAVGIIAFLYQRDSTKERIIYLSQELHTGLEVQEWTAGHLQKMEGLVAEWQVLDPDRASLERQLLHRRLTQSMHESFQHVPALSDRDITRIRSTLEELAEHDRALAARLDQDFQAALQERGKDDRK
jgi:hypothetical protein